MKRLVSAALMASWVLLYACSPSESAKPANDVPASQAESLATENVAAITFAQALEPINAKKMVAMEGYLFLPSVVSMTSKEIDLEFYERKFQRTGAEIKASLPCGEGKNRCAKLPANYKSTDLKITTVDGQLLPQWARVRLTGKLERLPATKGSADQNVILRVANIEQIEDIESNVASIDAFVLDKSTSAVGPLDPRMLCKLEGRMEQPAMLFIGDEIALDIKVGSTTIGAKIVVGNGPNQIEDLPQNYSSKDFKVHDHNGKLINLNRPVKVWGLYSHLLKDDDPTLKVEYIEQ